MTTHNQHFNYGSASWATFDEIKAAHFFEKQGLPFGFFDDRMMRFHSDMPRTLISGSGGGKFRDCLLQQTLFNSGMSMCLLDPKAEFWAVGTYLLSHWGIKAWRFDPFLKTGHTNKINPLSFLKRGSPSLFSDISRIAGTLIPENKNSNGKFWELTAQSVLIALLFYDVAESGNGRTSFPRLYKLISMIEGDVDGWTIVLKKMQESSHEFLRTQARAMLNRQLDAQREFSIVMSEVYANTLWLNDPSIRNALEDGEATVEDIIRDKGRLFVIVPGDLIVFASPAIRAIKDSFMIVKSRMPKAAPVILILDEVALLQRFSTLETAMSLGRGLGIIAQPVFQDLGQISTHYGQAGIQSFLGNSALQVYFNMREFSSANQLSRQIGMETLSYSDREKQANFYYQKQEQIRAFLDGADPVQTAIAYRHFEEASQRESKMRRPLIAADEVMGLDDDEMIAFVSGRNLPPILANKYPYYTRPEFTGRFLGHPEHNPEGRVLAQGRFGPKWLRVKEQRVPEKLRHFPQYASGFMQVIEEFNPYERM